MSRVGKQPIAVPPNIEIKLEPGKARVKGPKGFVEHVLPPEVTVAFAGGKLTVGRAGEQGRDRAMHGLVRALLANAVKGCGQGFEKRLDIVGVGYRVQQQGRSLSMQIGFCHPVVMPIPQGIDVEVPSNTKIIVKGADRQKVGQFAASLRKVRPPEPYKGKGIRYEGEHIKLKAGKKFAGGGAG